MEAVEAAFRSDYGKPSSFENVLDAVGRTPQQQRSLLSPFFQGLESSPGYDALALLVLRGLVSPILLSTNVDTLLEQSLRRTIDTTGRDWAVRVILQEEITDDTASSENEVLIVKLHGDNAREDVPLRVTEDATSRLSAAAGRFVAGLFREYGMIVVGYRIKDIGIRNVLQEVDASEGSLYWVLLEPEAEHDRDGSVLLGRHGFGDRGAIKSDFDEFFVALARGLSELDARRSVAERLDDAWSQLDRACAFGSERQGTLGSLSDEATSIALEADCAEVRALVELVSYQRQPRGESYRLEHGVRLLRNALDAYERFRRRVRQDETAWAEYSLLLQMRDLYLVAALSLSERWDHLAEIIERGERLLGRVGSDARWRARCMLLIGEAFKEKAMITAQPAAARADRDRARSRCEETLEMLAGLDDVAAIRYRATALRHLSVTFELKALSTEDQGEREALYTQWSNLAGDAADLLSTLGEDAVRGYALMNRASSFVRLAGFRSQPRQRMDLLGAGEVDLREAIDALTRVRVPSIKDPTDRCSRQSKSQTLASARYARPAPWK